MSRRLALAGAGLALAATGLLAARLSGGDQAAASTATVQREDFRAVVEATGKLETAVAYEVGPPSVQDFWEYNLTWMIPEGARVKQGEVIARFDATQIEERLREHRAALETALQEREKEERNLEISLRQLQLDLVRAEGELQKMEIELAVPKELMSSIEVEQLRLQKELALRRVDFLKQKIEFQQSLVRSKLDLIDVKRKFAEGKIAYNEDAKSRFEVRAPVAGLVIYIPKRNGDRWEVGEGVWMLAKILKVADVTTLRVEADVLEVDAARLAVGQPAEVSVDAMPGQKIVTRVSEIGRIVRERSLQDPSKVFDAILPLADPGAEALRPGMGVHVAIETSHLPGSLTVPLDAVRLSPEGPYVDVLEAGRAAARPVTLGQRNRERVVVESGLTEGDVVLRGSPPKRA